MERIIMHIDVNNAFLSWTAVDLLNKGYKVDIRKEVSVIGGDETKRRGIVLAKSIPAKKEGIQTSIQEYKKYIHQIMSYIKPCLITLFHI